ncbi:hypothetical protein KFE25_001397 [Diacronema lutheri]|uniref:Uncharacterized protein n=1 Tax=Diacronema lutheri TaxID=2081491 RepID=A0A8J5XJU5_DIALT|nr:hypothetical protein KFE25_001397 [Diacronema lutheri]
MGPPGPSRGDAPGQSTTRGEAELVLALLAAADGGEGERQRRSPRRAAPRRAAPCGARRRWHVRAARAGASTMSAALLPLQHALATVGAGWEREREGIDAAARRLEGEHVDDIVVATASVRMAAKGVGVLSASAPRAPPRRRSGRRRRAQHQILGMFPARARGGRRAGRRACVHARLLTSGSRMAAFGVQ